MTIKEETQQLEEELAVYEQVQHQKFAILVFYHLVNYNKIVQRPCCLGAEFLFTQCLPF